MVVFNSAYPKMVKFPRAGKKVKTSNFLDWFCLKNKLFEQKLDTAVSCLNTEGPWKVWGEN